MCIAGHEYNKVMNLTILFVVYQCAYLLIDAIEFTTTLTVSHVFSTTIKKRKRMTKYKNTFEVNNPT